MRGCCPEPSHVLADGRMAGAHEVLQDAGLGGRATRLCECCDSIARKTDIERFVEVTGIHPMGWRGRGLRQELKIGSEVQIKQSSGKRSGCSGRRAPVLSLGLYGVGAAVARAAAASQGRSYNNVVI